MFETHLWKYKMLIIRSVVAKVVTLYSPGSLYHGWLCSLTPLGYEKKKTLLCCNVICGNNKDFFFFFFFWMSCYHRISLAGFYYIHLWLGAFLHSLATYAVFWPLFKHWDVLKAILTAHMCMLVFAPNYSQNCLTRGRAWGSLVLIHYQLDYHYQVINNVMSLLQSDNLEKHYIQVVHSEMMGFFFYFVLFLYFSMLNLNVACHYVCYLKQLYPDNASLVVLVFSRD